MDCFIKWLKKKNAPIFTEISYCDANLHQNAVAGNDRGFYIRIPEGRSANVTLNREGPGMSVVYCGI